MDNSPVGMAAQAGGLLGIGMIGMAMTIPDLNFQAGGSVPSVGPGGPVPQVGAVGGGGLPTDSGIPTLSLSLALVPIGLLAVAVFPPFARFVKIHLRCKNCFIETRLIIH